MTRRDIVAMIAGAGIALGIAAVFLPGGSGIDARAQAAPEAQTERQRQLMLAVAGAMASIAVDGERTAISLNQTIDRMADLEARVKHLEKRLADLEARR